MKAIRFLFFIFIFNLLIVYKPLCKEILDLNSMIRFHVIANSDSKFDQMVKNQVKDEVIGYLELNVDLTNNKNQNIQTLNNHIPNILEVVNGVLNKYNLNYGVDIKLHNKYFEDRQLEGIFVPKGYYESFVIYLGESKGKNFWSMIFPSIGFIDSNSTSSLYDVVGTKDDIEVFSDNKKPKKYNISFKIVDIIKNIFK